MRARRAVVVLAAALTACGAPPPSQTPSPGPVRATPVPGVQVRADAFTTVVPPQWRSTDATPAAVEVGAAGGVTVLGLSSDAPTPAAGDAAIPATIEVVELPSPIADDHLGATLAAAGDRGAVNLSVAKPAYVAGAAGLVVTYDFDAGAIPAETEELLVNHGGDTWDITYTAAVANWTAQRPGLIDVLTAWRWTS